MSKWEEVRVARLIEEGALLISDGHRMRNDQLGNSGIPFVRGGDIGDGWVNTSVTDHIRPEFENQLRSKLSQPEDVVFITKGTVGRAGYIRTNQPSVVFSPQVALWRVLDKKRLSPRFIFYLVRGSNFQAALDAVKSHGAMAADYVSISQQYEFRFRLPDAPTQYAIGSLLGSLDDKIELNRRMNETLEAMAQAIFRDWFVDFGPTRRKLAGATDPVAIMGGFTPDPTRAADLAALFPGALNDEGLPEGWSEVSLSSLLEIIGGGTPRTSVEAYWGGSIPWFSVVDTPSGSDSFVFSTEKSITDLGLAESSARLVPAGTTIISARGTVGNLAVAAQDMAFNQSCYALRSSRGKHPCFVYESAAHAVERLRAMAHGSVFSTITRQTFDSLVFPEAPLPVVDAYEAVAGPLFERLRASVAENRTLAETRDYLLPRLMSGTVRVADAARDVAA